MLEAQMKPIDASPTEAELKAMAVAAYNERLGQFCDEQRANPRQAAMHSAANLAYADYYHRLATNGAPFLFPKARKSNWRHKAGTISGSNDYVFWW